MALETVTIEQTQFLSAKPVEVYDALVNPKKHSEFTGTKATGEAVAGGEFTAYDGYISGTYVIVTSVPSSFGANWNSSREGG